MENRFQKTQSRGLLLATLIVLVAVTIAAWSTGIWVLTAVPIGLLFGFFLEKGDLCGASAFSEVLVMKDGRKLWGIWVAIVTGMVGFALLEQLGWIQWHAKPFLWANYVVGGVLFGVGMVLAGGCVSGTLYKAGEGHLNSIVALLAIPIGIGLVEHGPLTSVQAHLKSLVIKSGDGGPVTLSSVTGIPHWALALLLGALTLVISLYWRRKKSVGTRVGHPNSGLPGAWLARSWKPWLAGLFIGILGCFAYVSSAASGRNYPLGVTHGVYHVELLFMEDHLTYVYQPATASAATAQSIPARAMNGAAAPPATTPTPAKKVSWWLIALVISLVAGSWVSARSSGKARLIAKPPEQVVVSIIGGLLVGIGAAFATGCVIGNIISGIALMSVGVVLFTAVVILANWATTYLYLMGGSLKEVAR